MQAGELHVLSCFRIQHSEFSILVVPMPQETKSHPFNADGQDVALGVVHENLEGWIPPLATDEEIHVALEKAFDYRGDVTITRKDETKIEGYVFDRRTGSTLADSF